MISVGTIVKHEVEHHGKVIEIEYRRDVGQSEMGGGFWSYKPSGYDQWIPIKSWTIRKNLDTGLHPRNGYDGS